MKFIKSIMTAALLTAGLATVTLASGQDEDTMDSVSTYGYKKGTDGTESVLEFSEAALTALTDATYDPKKGRTAEVKAVKRLLGTVLTEAVDILKLTFDGNGDDAIRAIITEAKKVESSGAPLTVSLVRFKPGHPLDPDLKRSAVSALVSLVSSEEPIEIILKALIAMRSHTEGTLACGSRLTIDTIYGEYMCRGAGKAKALADAKEFKSVKRGETLDVLLARKKAKYAPDGQYGVLGLTTPKQIAALKHIKRSVRASVPRTIHTPEQMFGWQLYIGLRKAVDDGALMLSTDISNVSRPGLVQSIIGEFIGLREALVAHRKEIDKLE